MRILVFSDTHLNDQFEEKKYRLLESNIKKFDRVIINGDFWEGFILTFDQFINSPWKGLFPHLLAKKAIYLFGNHDRQEYADKRTSLFSTKQLPQYKLLLGNKELIFEHGNRLLPFFDEYIKFKQPMPRFMKTYNAINRPLTRTFKDKFINLVYRPQNKIIKNKLKKELKNNQIMITGHTHAYEIDLKNKYINTGFIRHGWAQYIIIENGKFKMINEWYD